MQLRGGGGKDTELEGYLAQAPFYERLNLELLTHLKGRLHKKYSDRVVESRHPRSKFKIEIPD